MIMADGYTDLPPGKIASVVTFLEMRERRLARLEAAPAGLSIRRVQQPALYWYRRLYRAVGTEWLWFSRLRMNDQQLAAIIHDPRVHVYAVKDGQEDKGLLELDERSGSEIEIGYFGVTGDLFGRGVGRWLMGH